MTKQHKLTDHFHSAHCIICDSIIVRQQTLMPLASRRSRLTAADMERARDRQRLRLLCEECAVRERDQLQHVALTLIAKQRRDNKRLAVINAHCRKCSGLRDYEQVCRGFYYVTDMCLC